MALTDTIIRLAKIIERATAGEFRYLTGSYGQPEWIAEPDIATLRATKLAADADKKQRKPAGKTAKQLEAEWAKLSAENARASPRGSAFNEHHLRMTLPFPELKKPDDPKD